MPGDVSSLIVTRQEIKAWNAAAVDILIPQKKEFLIRKVQSGLPPTENSLALLHFPCFALHFYTLACLYMYMYIRTTVSVGLEEKVSRRCPVDEGGPNNRDLLWRTRREGDFGAAVNRKAPVPATRRYKTHGMHPRVSCIPGSVAFYAGSTFRNKTSSSRLSRTLALASRS